jgi:hypothetical protein
MYLHAITFLSNIIVLPLFKVLQVGFIELEIFVIQRLGCLNIFSSLPNSVSCILKDGSQGDCNLACNTSDSYTSTQSADPVGTYTPARTTKPGLINTDEGLPSTADRGAWLLALCVTTAGTLGSLVYSK